MTRVKRLLLAGVTLMTLSLAPNVASAGTCEGVSIRIGRVDICIGKRTD